MSYDFKEEKIVTLHLSKVSLQSKNHTKIIAFSHGLAPYLLWDEHLYHPEKHIEKMQFYSKN